MPAEHYLAIKSAHIALVATSGALFAIRGAAVFARQAWPMHKAVRVASVAIDTLLLGAGAALWFGLALHPLRDPWLGAKLLLLVFYIALGALALKRRHVGAYAAALACFLFMVSVALAHHPLGLLKGLA